MAIAIEYMSDFVVGPPLFDPNLVGSRSSGGDQRMLVALAGVAGVTGESRSPATFVSPLSARQARPSSEMRIFFYNRVSGITCKYAQKSYPFQVTVGGLHAMEILKTCVLQL